MTRTRPSRPRHAGHRARRRAGAALALVAVLVLLAGAAVLRDLWRPIPEPADPEATAPQAVSCARYGLDGVQVASRGPGDEEETGLLDLRVLGPGDRSGDRFNLRFEHGGVVSRYHVLAQGLDWDRPVGVVYHFHGDGAFEYEKPQYSVSCMAEVAREHNMLLVVARTPDLVGEPTWWEEIERNGAWFRALAEERLPADYDVDRSRTWLSGYSGGAQFIGRELLADHVDLVPGGGAILLGGGEAPSAAASPPTPAQLRGLRLHWDVGRQDDGSDPRARFDALSAARAGHRWYERAGFERTSLTVREGVDHFGLPYAGILDRILTEAETEAGAGDGQG